MHTLGSCVLLLALLTGTPVKVTLGDGTVLEGTLVQESESLVAIEVEGQVLVYPRDARSATREAGETEREEQSNPVRPVEEELLFARASDRRRAAHE